MTRIGAAAIASSVISEGLWKRRFQQSPSVLGQRVQIDGEAYTVVGVAPSGFSEVWRLDVWIPLGQVADPSNRGSNFLLSFGRLRDGMTLERGAPRPRRAGGADVARQRDRQVHASPRGRCTK